MIAVFLIRQNPHLQQRGMNATPLLDDILNPIPFLYFELFREHVILPQLHGQSMASLAASARKYRPAALRSHASPKAMGSLAFSRFKFGKHVRA